MYKINQDLAEETGIHVGDGSMNVYNENYCYTLACHHIDDKEFMDDYIAPLYKRTYGIGVKLRNWSQGTYGFRIHDKNCVTFKHDILGLPLGKKADIKIPEQILDSTDFQKAFLRGFVSTDGSISTFLANKKSVYPRIEMCNVSQELMIQINDILKNLGFKTSIWKINKSKPKWNEALRLTLNGFNMLKRWDDEIGFINPKHTNKLNELLSKE